MGDETLSFGTHQLRLLVINKSTADQTWIVDTADGPQIAIGALYVGDFSVNTSDKTSASVEHSWSIRGTIRRRSN